MTDDRINNLFKSVLNQHPGIVLRVARAYAGSSDACQDLSQEILLQVWVSLPSFEERSRLSTWVYRVALNTAIGWKRRKHPHIFQRRTIIKVEDLSSTEGDGIQQAIQQEMLDRLYAAIRRLPEADTALILLSLDDQSYREMSEVLGISESHVGVKLSRAKKMLSEILKENSHVS